MAPQKKAILIGINYEGHKAGVLRGCHNDVKNMTSFVASQGYNQENIILLLDTPGAPQDKLPTRANITNGFKWLLKDAKAGDSLFIHYSGHGGQQVDTDGDEEDGMDETLVPLDYQTAGQITDDELHRIIVQPLPEGCKLTCVFDCCHSGTILDLPYIYKPGQDGKGVEHTKMDFATLQKEALRHANNYKNGQTPSSAEIQSLLAGCCGFLSASVGMGGATQSQSAHAESQPLRPGNGNNNVASESKKKGGNIVMISGCQDNQVWIRLTLPNPDPNP